MLDHDKTVLMSRNSAICFLMRGIRQKLSTSTVQFCNAEKSSRISNMMYFPSLKQHGRITPMSDDNIHRQILLKHRTG